MVEERADGYLFHVKHEHNVKHNFYHCCWLGIFIRLLIIINIGFIHVDRLFAEHCSEVELASFAVFAAEFKRVKPSDQREEREESVD